jgi:hypothetical protein
MDETVITFYLARKGLSAVAIHADLVITPAPELMSYPSVTHCLHQANQMSFFLNPNRSWMIQTRLPYMH